MRSMATRGSVLALALAVLGVVGCGGKKGAPNAPAPDPEPAAGVVVSAAIPASGAGTLTGLSITISDVTIGASTPGKRVRMRGVANGKEHKIDVIFVTASSAISSVTHTWGTDVDPGGPAPDAINTCSSCSAAQVSVNQGTKKVTLNGLVLPDGGVNAANTSTLTGTNTWP